MSSSATEAWVTHRGTGLHLTVYRADGPAVVFIPPFRSTAASCAQFCTLLCDEGLTVVALDLQGHGLSGGRRGHMPFGDALGNIAETVGFARERFGAPVGLVGSGLGGVLAFYAALEDDRVEAVACHTVADLREAERLAVRFRARMLLGARAAVRRVNATVPMLPVPARLVVSPDDMFDDPATMERWRRLPRAPRAYTLDTVASFFLEPDTKPAIEAMTKPVFVVTGSEDRAIPLTAQRDVVARLDDAEMFVLGGAGHMLAVEYPRETAPRIAEWLRKRL